MDPSSSSSSSLPRLPNVADLAPQHGAFLDQHFQTKRDLSQESSHLSLSSSLSQQCAELDSFFLLHATKRTVSWIARSFRAKSSLQQLSLSLRNLSLRTSPRMKEKKCFFIYMCVFSFRAFVEWFWMLFFVFRWNWFEEVSAGFD